MGDRTNYGSSSKRKLEIGIVQKQEVDMEFPCSSHFGNDIASSSGTNLRSSFLSMGFQSSLVDKVIRENGEDDADLLLETLFAYSALQNSNSESSDSVFDDTKEGYAASEFAADSHPKAALHKSNSDSTDSLDSLFDDKGESTTPQLPLHIHLKNEPDIDDDDIKEDKRASLLAMNFSVNEVNFAMEKLGNYAPVPELVDFIFAAQMAEKFENLEEVTIKDEEINEETNTERLFGTMETTLRLLEMGFSESQISLAIDRFGSELPISELADSIFSGKLSDSHPANSGSRYDTFNVKKEEYTQDDANYQINNDFNFEEYRKGKKPKQEYFDDSSSSITPFWLKSSRNNNPQIPSLQSSNQELNKFKISRPFKSSPCKSVDKAVSKPPYFFYGNVVNLTHDSWEKISQFLYNLEPEFVNSQFFSALNRREGYVHNIPTENRFHVVPKSPPTIEDAIPTTKKWWPAWDTRKHLSCISTETFGTYELCETLGKNLIGSHGRLSIEQQKDLLHQCKALNLVWVGQYKLSPLEPEHLERILGYPVHHTQTQDWSSTERLQSLKTSFQTDTLGYHLSVLKSMFPEGITVLSIFSGIGGAEIALHRLGIRLKGVVSVEASGTMRKVLERWWRNTGQSGELVQLEGIERLTTTRLEGLVKKFGGFDFIIGQTPSSLKNSKIVMGGDGMLDFDFALFYEFVRVLQRVRSLGQMR